MMGQVIAKADGNTGDLKESYVYANGERLLTKTYSYDDTGTETITQEYGFTDVQGSMILTADALTGEVTSRTKYDPYGEVVWSMQKGLRETEYSYTGKEKDPTIGLTYFGARWYDGDAGRFVSTDLIDGYMTNPISINRYQYCYDNPVTYTDPMGLDPYNPYFSVNRLESSPFSAEFSAMGIFDFSGSPSSYFRQEYERITELYSITLEYNGETYKRYFSHSYSPAEVSYIEQLRNFNRETGRTRLKAVFYFFQDFLSIIPGDTYVHNGFALENINNPGTYDYYDFDVNPAENQPDPYRNFNIQNNITFHSLKEALEFQEGDHHMRIAATVDYQANNYQDLVKSLYAYSLAHENWNLIPIMTNQANCTTYANYAFSKMTGINAPFLDPWNFIAMVTAYNQGLWN